MRGLLAGGMLWLGAALAAPGAGAPKIQFDSLVYDFGKTSVVESVAGVFKFKNAGDAVLKIEPPRPSCGCTPAALKQDTLQPGESGELTFTLNLGKMRAVMEKLIVVKSNDPQTPEVTLTIKADYTPLYDVSPMALAPILAYGDTETEQLTTVTRTDGKPLHLLRLEASKPWITAKVEPGAKAEDSTARVRVVVKRDGPPRRFNEFVHLYTSDETNGPVSTIYLYGQIQGELSLSPEALYWSVTDAAQPPAERPEAAAVRRVVIRSGAGRAFELKNPQSTLAAIQVELVPKEAGKVYELVATLKTTPPQTVSGTVSVETSVAAQPKLELPVIVNVFKP